MTNESIRFENLVERLNLDETCPLEEVEHLIEGVRVEDIAEIFTRLREPARRLIFQALGDEKAAELLSELDEIPAMQILQDLSPDRIAAIVNFLPPDEATDVIGFSDREDHPQILRRVEDELASQIQDLTTYSPDTAGGVMTSEFESTSPADTVRSALINIKTSEIADSVQYVYVLDEDEKLTGVVSVRDLLQARLNQSIEEIMEADVVAVPLEMDQEDVSRILSRYNFLSIPVVDYMNRLKGIITFDDIMDVIEEESSEDIYRMAGEVIIHPTQQPFHRRLAARMPWLLVTLVGTFLAALLIQFFEEIFEGPAKEGTETLWTLLLCFIPMIGGMAGNVGIQSSTVMVRGLATGEVSTAIFMRLLLKEVFLAAAIGLISGLLIGSVVFLFYNQIGFVVALALFGAIVFAAFLGTVMPFACLWAKVDPAYASGPVLTTMNDLLGFLIYFLIAITLLK